VAGVTVWIAAALGLLPPLLLAVVAAGRGPAGGRLVAVQLASAVAVLLSVALSFIEDQSSSIDLALALALLSFPATLVFALFEERWI
jgi:multisubunit Na+/H+ antiporter MnhF subunit